MNNFLLEWQLLIIPIAVVIISQLIKVLLETKKQGFHISHLNNYGGMPSSHTAFFVSIATTTGLVEGSQSPLFFITLFLAFVFVRDAVGIRWALSLHGKALNHILDANPNIDRTGLPEKLNERLGHRPIEALAGGITGVITTVVLYWLINGSF